MAIDPSGTLGLIPPPVLIEVIVSRPRDAIAAQAGGAHRLELAAAPQRGGLSPDPQTVRSVLAETDLPVRVMLRAQEPHHSTPGVIDTLSTHLEHLLAAGAREFVVGLLGDDNQVEGAAFGPLLSILGRHRWTFHRALDDTPDLVAGVSAALALPGCDTVLVAGDRRGVAYGTSELVRLLHALPTRAGSLLFGGGLRPAHLAPLIAAGARSFHLGRAVRTGHSWGQPIEAALVQAVAARAQALQRRTVST